MGMMARFIKFFGGAVRAVVNGLGKLLRLIQIVLGEKGCRREFAA